MGTKLTQIGLEATPLPSRLLFSIWLQKNKMDELSLQENQAMVADCFTYIFIETMLHCSSGSKQLLSEGQRSGL